MKVLISSLVILGVLSGCSMWPTLKEDSALNPSDANASPCITSDGRTARQCALLTISEVSGLLDDVGSYNRGSAYTALGLGTITGGVLAFDGSKDILEGVAVLSGGMLGLNSIVDTASQRAIYEKSLRDLTCSIRAFDALQAASVKQNVASENYVNLQNKGSPIVLYSADSRLASLYQQKHFQGLNASAQALTYAKETKKALYFEKLTKDGIGTFRALDSAQVSAGSKLSAAVISIRADIRAKLAGMVVSPEEILGTQRDRIVDMVGDIASRRAELENQQDEQASEGDEAAEEATDAVASLIADTSGITSVFRDCVDPATQREIEK